MGPVLFLALSFSYLNNSPMSVIIFIAIVNEFIVVHSRAPQNPKDKIVSTYKRKPKQPWVGCVVGQRLRCV